MLGRSVGIAATCVLGASAFLIPAGIATTSDISASIVNPKEQIITLPCSECAFPYQQEKVASADEEDLFRIQGGANSLVLNFTISEDGQKLQLNGKNVYPTAFAEPPVHVKQVPSEVGLVDIKTGHALSTDLEVTALAMEEQDPLPAGGKDLLLSFVLDIGGLESQRVHLDEVAIKLLQTEEGELLIMRVERVPKSSPDAVFGWPADIDSRPSHHGPPHDHKPATECDVLPSALCKLKAIIDSKINQATSHGASSPKKGGCRGRKGPPGTHLPTHIRPHLVRPDQDGRPPFNHGRPHHMRPHGPHHGHHGPSSHSFWRGFADGLIAVIVPIMAGVAVGMAVSLLGLVVGRTIGYLWIKIARGGRRGSASGVTVIEEGENEGMLAKMEPPPVYEDAPAYEENEKEVI